MQTNLLFPAPRPIAGPQKRPAANMALHCEVFPPPHFPSHHRARPQHPTIFLVQIASLYGQSVTLYWLLGPLNRGYVISRAWSSNAATGMVRQDRPVPVLRIGIQCWQLWEAQAPVLHTIFLTTVLYVGRMKLRKVPMSPRLPKSVKLPDPMVSLQRAVKLREKVQCRRQ